MSGDGFAAVPSRRRLHPLVAKARNLVRQELADLAPQELVLVACSGGPDSLALASVAAFFARRKSLRVGAVVVDHGLQKGSAEVAQRTAAVLTELGLSPVEVSSVRVNAGAGPEAAARAARYGALDAAALKHGASRVLLGHTLDDQAEQVLLGLARGSGTRSLAGMPRRRPSIGTPGLQYLRPFLELRRAETSRLCELQNLDPWQDPSNQDPVFARSRVRHRVLPVLEAELGPGVAESLFRSASILAQDADYLDELSQAAYLRCVEPAGGAAELFLSEAQLRELPPAIRQRVLAIAITAMGGTQPSFERLQAAEALLSRKGSAGPVQLSGGVSIYRLSRTALAQNSKQAAKYGKLVVRRDS